MNAGALQPVAVRQVATPLPSYFVHHTGGAIEPIGGLLQRRPRPAQRAETQHRKYKHYSFHRKTSFLLPRRRISGFRHNSD
jgi:hypothetical protein